MKRRDMFAGLALAGMAAGENAEPGSLYIPNAHRVDDRALLHDFMDEFPFAELVTASPEIRITHIPVLLDRSAGGYGTLYGHISRQNPQVAALDGQHPAVLVFHGPHAYISPTWYANPEAVPTWNFATVHASGKPKSIADADLADLLNRLVKKFETGAAYSLAKLPDGYKQRLMSGITGFRMEIGQLEGKFKLGQERSEADRQSILRHLRAAAPQRTIAGLTAAFYERVSARSKDK